MTKRRDGGIRELAHGRIEQWGYASAGGLITFYRPMRQGGEWTRGRWLGGKWKPGRFVPQSVVTIKAVDGGDVMFHVVTDGIITFGAGERLKWRVVGYPDLSALGPRVAQSEDFYRDFTPRASMFNPQPQMPRDPHPPAR